MHHCLFTVDSCLLTENSSISATVQQTSAQDLSSLERDRDILNIYSITQYILHKHWKIFPRKFEKHRKTTGSITCERDRLHNSICACYTYVQLSLTGFFLERGPYQDCECTITQTKPIASHTLFNYYYN